MASRRDEVEHGVDTVVPETGVALDTGLLGENIIVLSLKVTDNLGEAARPMSVYVVESGVQRELPSFVVDLVSESRGIDDGQRDASTLLIQLQL